MSRPTSGKQRPLSGSRALKSQSADVISYEDLLVAQYLEELKKSPPYTKTSTASQPSPYLQKLGQSHIVPTPKRPLSATVGGGTWGKTGEKPKIDPKFIADPSLWDPATPGDDAHHDHVHTQQRTMSGSRRRPISAPVYKRPVSAYSRPGSAKSGKKTKSLYRRQPQVIVVTAFKNGSREVFARIAAPSIKVLLEMATDKLALPTAGRRVYLSDGSEVFTPRQIERETEIYISCGEPFKDPLKPVKYQTTVSKSASWTMNGLTWNNDAKKKTTKTVMSKRFRTLIEQSRRRVLVFKNGSGTQGVEIVADPDRLEDFLVACTAKCELGSYARVLYDWEGKSIAKLEEAPVLDRCLQTSSTPVLGPLWVSRGEGFSPKGVEEFLKGLIKYTNSKLKEAQHYKNQLKFSQIEEKRERVVIASILSMTEKEVEEALEIVEADIQDFTNALNRLQEQMDNIMEMLGEEVGEGNQYTMKHIKRFDIDHKLVGTRGIRLRVCENGTEDETVIYFNLQAAKRGLENRSDRRDLLKDRFMSELSTMGAICNPKKTPNIRPVPRKIFNEVGKEIRDVEDLEYDQRLWLSYGEPFKNPFTYVLTVHFDKVRVYDIEIDNPRRTAVREQLMSEDVQGNERPNQWEICLGIPDEYKNVTVLNAATNEQEKEQIMGVLSFGEIPVNNCYFLRNKENPNILLCPDLVMDSKKSKGSKEIWPGEAQTFVISTQGYIYCKAMPQLVLGVQDQKVSTSLSHPIKGHSQTKVEGFCVGLQKKASSSVSQQWEFNKEGNLVAQSHRELVLTCLGSLHNNEESQVTNTDEGSKSGQKFYMAVCDKLEGKMAKTQRFGIKQEKFENLGQWKHTHVENPEWSKQALSWPIDEHGELNRDYDWPMEGFILPYAPPLTKKGIASSGLGGHAPLRMLVLKNGVRDISKAVPVVGPDLNNMRKDMTKGKDKKKGKRQTASDKMETDSIDADGMVHCDEELTVLKLEFILYLERCTSAVNLPFAGRRLFDENGKEFFSLRGLRRDQLIYVSCGEAWCDPNISKAEQQRRYLLSNLASDVKQMEEYCTLRSPQNLVLQVNEELKVGSKLGVNECAMGDDNDPDLEEQAEKYAAYQKALQENKETQDQINEIVHGNLTAHEMAHIKADERLERLKLPWERVVNQGGDGDLDEEEKNYSNKDMYHRYKPKKKKQDLLTQQLQKFAFDDGYIMCASNTNLVLGLQESDNSSSTQVILVKRRPDDINQRWILQENGIIQCKNNPSLVLSVSMPVYQTKSEGDEVATYCDSQVVVQKRKMSQFGRANQRFYYDEETGFIQAFHTDTMDKEVTAANRANVCTFSVMGTTEIDQPGYVAEVQVEKGSKAKRLLVCSSCARAMRGRYKLEKIKHSVDFSCAMGSAKEHGVKQIGSFQCLNGKVDLSTHEAEHTLEEWYQQLQRLREECSVRAIAKEISVAKVPYTVKVLAYKNGEGRIKPGEVIVGSSVAGLMEQATQRLGLTQAGRRVYTLDGNIILDLDDLVEWARVQYSKNARDLLRAEKRSKKIAEAKARGEKIEHTPDDSLMDKVDLDSDLESSEEESEVLQDDREEVESTGEGFLVGYDIQEDRKHSNLNVKNILVIPNPLQPIPMDGFILHWMLYATKTGPINLMVVRPVVKEPGNYQVVAATSYIVSSRGEHQVDLANYPMECKKGDLIAFYCQDDLMIPFDVDESENESTLFTQSRSKPEVGATLFITDEWGKGGTKQFSLNAYIVKDHKVQLNTKTRPKSAKLVKKPKKVKKEKGPFVELPPLELVLRYPIEVWVSCGEPFIKPQRVEKTYEQEIQQREERAAVALELEKEKHALRQLRGKRYGAQNPGEYRATSNPSQPVYVQGHWQDPTLDELQKHDAVHQLQKHLTEVKSNQRKKTGVKACNVHTTRRLYTQPVMKRILVFPNGDSIERAQYVWGETLSQLLDNSTTRLNLRKAARYIFTLDEKLVSDISEVERDQIVCVSATKQFMLPKENQQTVEVKANWGRARKQYGPGATDIMVTTQNNQAVNVDPFGPSTIAGGPTKPRRGVYPSTHQTSADSPTYP